MIGRPLGIGLQKPDPSFVSMSSIIASLTFGRDSKSYLGTLSVPPSPASGHLYWPKISTPSGGQDFYLPSTFLLSPSTARFAGKPSPKSAAKRRGARSLTRPSHG